MNIDHYIAQLDSTDQNARSAAADALVGAGSKALPALLRALREADSASSADACMTVLRRLGPLAYRALLELLSGSRAEFDRSEEPNRIPRLPGAGAAGSQQSGVLR
ncbi:hypothetical protein AB0H00_23470 [Nocardia sp. NPDC023852]|uniref:hypothetical protein n=1 Tax=Nocardia sp. NPDC023852 TaxID=3154697 RepID=UPI0034075158